MNACCQPQRRVGVAQVVEANLRQPGLGYQTLKGKADHVRVKAAAVGLAEDKAFVVVDLTRLDLLSGPCTAPVAQGADGSFVQRDYPPTRLGPVASVPALCKCVVPKDDKRP